MAQSAVAEFHGTAIFPRRARVLAAAISELLPREASVLDVGSGDGTIAAQWMQARPDLRVEGIDVLVRPDTKIPVRAFDGRTIPYPDRSFDVVSFVDVLHHADDAARLLREAARVARHSVVIKDHYAENRLDRATLALMDWVANAHHGVALPYHYWSRAEWQRAFAAAALSVDELRTKLPLYPFPFSMVFGRGLHFVARLRTPHAA